jgi:uncharacterized protein (TIGR00725 family)
MDRVAAVITTRDRTALFEKAFRSVIAQTQKPDLFIVTSDSTEENFEIEKGIVGDKAILIRNRYARNYAGNLNTALDWIVKSEYGKARWDIADLFIAFLDDDDAWHPDYLSRCLSVAKPETDMVVGLIHYLADGKDFILDLPPENLNEKSFLAINPHVQGSNTFVRLRTILMAGAFDESLNSTTDRDFFTRVMMLKPNIEFIPHPLLDVDAHDSRPRLTNDASGKRKSLAYFYSKYSGLMDGSIKAAFFKRALRYTDLTEETVCSSLEKEHPQPYVPDADSAGFNHRIVVGFITSDAPMAARLLDDLSQQKIARLSVVVFYNGVDVPQKFLEKVHSLSGRVISLPEARGLVSEMPFADYIRPSVTKGDSVRDIAVSRMILHYLLKKNSVDGDVVWILDDDMRLATWERENGSFKCLPLDLAAVSKRYLDQADVVVGSYTGDAPLPSLATLRTSLLDYVYSTKLGKKDPYRTDGYDQRDYYYDFADCHLALEEPLSCSPEATLADVFSGKATSRVLFARGQKDFEAYSRGGNTIIYNRAALDMPNISPVFGDVIARRSDYFWVEELKRGGYKVVGASFGTFHDRPSKPFDYRAEEEKLLKDTLGSSFTKAVSEKKVTSRESFYLSFRSHFEDRLTRIIDSYYRVIGLLRVLGDEKYSRFLNEEALANLARKSKPFLERSLAQAAYDYAFSLFSHHLSEKKIPEIAKAAAESLGHKVTLLGSGNEGAVFQDGKSVIKVFFEKVDLSLLRKWGREFGLCQELFAIEVLNVGDFDAIRYENGKEIEPYRGGHAQELADLIRFLRKRGLALSNIKRDNFLLMEGHLKFIDFGRNIVPLTDETYAQEVHRAYEMLRYPELTIPEYKRVVSLSHLGEDGPLCFGIEAFERLIEKRGKERIHDPLVLSLAQTLKPASVLDYGAGKCKIVNALPSPEKAAFDIDLPTLKASAGKDVRIVEDIDLERREYDLVLCNLVLCAVDEAWCKKIVTNIRRLLKDGGRALVSVCDPFFDDVERTETHQSGRSLPYVERAPFLKKTAYGEREDWHRSFAFYENLFRRNGFMIESVAEDDGVDVDSLESVGEHLVFSLKKSEFCDLSDCTLLVKACAMDHQIAGPLIRSMVRKLENGCAFKERVVVVDGKAPVRNRRYSEDDEASLRKTLDELLSEGIVDRVIYCDNGQGLDLYRKYFGCESSDPYSANGQQLLTTLKGFEAVKTRYVYQTDIDIAFFGAKEGDFARDFEIFRRSGALTGCLSIAHGEDVDSEFGRRTEVRSCFLDLAALAKKLPLRNPLADGVFSLPWHRALDGALSEKDSLRFHAKGLCFAHFTQDEKKDPNFVSLVSGADAPALCQRGSVDAAGTEKDWTARREEEMVVFSRGKDIPPVKLRRFFRSLSSQKKADFGLAYYDDGSETESREYLEMISRYDPSFATKSTFVFNSASVSSLANFDRALHNAILNPKQIVVNVDGDDALLCDDAISVVGQTFSEGADLSVGNCLRLDKPLRKYSVESFKKCWERDGDNVWCHPKCFRRYLFGYIGDRLKIKGKYVDVATDYAMMLPLIGGASHPEFIAKQIYLFDPSEPNRSRREQYRLEHKIQMKKALLERAKEEYMKPIVSIIGDAAVPESDSRYKAAFVMGKALVDAGYRVQSGGMGGVMEAAFKGAHSSSRYEPGDTIAILPGEDETGCNAYCDVKVCTGLDHMRAEKVVSSTAVIAIGGGAGTLEEMAVAWETFRLLLAYKGVEGWSGKLADTRIDPRIRYENVPEDKVYGVGSPEEAIDLIKKYSNVYTRIHTKIARR